ncbi:hypothetical protein BaRGS_00037512 [Batillaria attramentaria]|uniref:Uncharacterized protein n=1 Tax=Batillaria attramentaria TaxID=370345 RepID=A0ABD0J8P0_9CAEN
MREEGVLIATVHNCPNTAKTAHKAPALSKYVYYVIADDLWRLAFVSCREPFDAGLASRLSALSTAVNTINPGFGPSDARHRRTGRLNRSGAKARMTTGDFR